MWRIAATMASAAAIVLAQAPAFEVASIRMSPGGMISISPPDSPGFTAQNVSMQILISLAYGGDSDRVQGPGWIGSQQYDVTAKTEGERKLSYDELKPLLQDLLAQRFQLKVHTQMKEGSGYALVVAKGGAKLQETKGAADHSYILPNSLDVQNRSMAAFAGALSRPAGRPVVDETGLKGNYDIRVNYAEDQDKNPTLPSIFTALQEQLGLQLVPKKVPVEFIIVDHVERTPAEN
jgi:uncharacterized protein (TIGR03435 family)